MADNPLAALKKALEAQDRQQQAVKQAAADHAAQRPQSEPEKP